MLPDPRTAVQAEARRPEVKDGRRPESARRRPTHLEIGNQKVSSLSLRRSTIDPKEIRATAANGVLTVTVPGLAWAGSKQEFNDLIAAALSAVRDAEDHASVLAGMIPKGGAK